MFSSIKASLNRLRMPALDPAAEVRQLFRAPPFTPEVAAALRLISPRLQFRPDERSRLLCQAEANGMCEREFEALRPLLEQRTKPQRVLEIGPGFGRSVVYFCNKGVWSAQAEVHLYDTNGKATKYKQRYYDRPPKWPDVSSFCGNLSLLQAFLDFNQIRNCRVFDAAQLPINRLPGPYDLVYSFFSVGFHWSLEFYLDELDPLLGPKSLLICTVNKHFQPFERLREFSTRILPCRDLKRNARPLLLLALSKGELPRAGYALAEAFPSFTP